MATKGNEIDENYRELVEQNNPVKKAPSNIFEITGIVDKEEKRFILDSREKTVKLLGFAVLIEEEFKNGDYVLPYVQLVEISKNSDIKDAQKIILKVDTPIHTESIWNVKYANYFDQTICEYLRSINPSVYMKFNKDLIDEEYYKKILTITDIRGYSNGPLINKLNRIYEITAN